MARKRMIDPGIWDSEDFSNLDNFAKLIWIGLFSQADDEGRGKAKSTYLKSILFPYSEDNNLAKKVDKALTEIAKCMSITFYKNEGNEYYQLENWNRWQKVDKPQKSKISPCCESSLIIRRTIGEQSAKARELFPPNKIEKNRIENKRDKNACACTREEISLELPSINIDCEIPANFDLKLVSQAISKSDYLKKVTSLRWFVDNYEKIVSGYYKNLQTKQIEGRAYSQREYKDMISNIDEVIL